MPEPDYLTAKRLNNGLRELMQTAAWQGDWSPARKLAYNERRIERLAKQQQRKLDGCTMSHTPDPWEPSLACEFDINSCNASHVASVSPHQDAEAIPNRDRIIACVNGCAGLDPAAYRACVDALKELVEFHDEDTGWREQDATLK